MIFYVNLPVAVALAIAALKVVPADTAEAALARPRPARRAARNDEPRRDRLRDHAGRQRRLDVDPDARSRRSAASPGSPPSRSTSATPTQPLLRDRADRRPRRRRRALPDARRRRLDLRALPALLALPPERARHGARSRPASPSSRSPSPQGSARTRPATSSASHGVRGPLAGAFAVAAVGMALLAHVGENGSYLRDVLPGMLDRRMSASASPSSPSRSRSSPAPARRRPG